MAVHPHTEATLSEIVSDMKDLTSRLERIRRGMLDVKLEELGFDGHSGQVKGRTAISGFVASGETNLRKAIDRLNLSGEDEE